ncbi:hypothetical protein C8R48DRAFT_674495 [Suillus tomentosus]|nr:hypothetical protein C8R48DRAFT_674495 [Suillus tomentosus]
MNFPDDSDVLQLGRVLWSLNAYDYFLTLADEWHCNPGCRLRFIDKDPQGIFLTRVCAIWELRKRVTAMLVISGLLYLLTAHVVLSINRSAPEITKSPIPVTSCFETGDGSTLIIVYVILAVMEILIEDPPEIWIFMLYKAIASYWREGTHNRLLGQLVLHNTIYMTCGLNFQAHVQIF